ncbi:MAG: hypothetical protein ACK5JU_06845, partial [Bacteroidales bacterium]
KVITRNQQWHIIILIVVIFNTKKKVKISNKTVNAIQALRFLHSLPITHHPLPITHYFLPFTTYFLLIFPYPCSSMQIRGSIK